MRRKATLNDVPDPAPQPQRWPPAGAITPPARPMPGWGVTIWRGLCCQCPHCGKSKIFAGYLRVNPECGVCGAKLGDLPADDAPPYLAMVVVLHILAVFLIIIFSLHEIPGIIGGALWLCLLAALCCVLLRLAKGMVIGILLKLGITREPLNG